MAPKPTATTMYAFDDDEDDDHVALNLSAQQLQQEQDLRDQEQSLGAGENKKKKRYDEDDELAYYKDEEEMYGVREVLSALTKDEIEAFPDEQMPLRHYRAEKGNIEKAIAQLKATIQWREEFGVTNLIHCLDENRNETSKRSDDDGSSPTKEELAKIIRLENETGKLYVRGHDKGCRSLLYMRPSAENTNVELDNLRHLVYNLEKAIACTTKREGNEDGMICLIIDYEGFQMRHAPSMSTARKTLNILQHHYPERMYRVYLCNPPLLFRTVWAMVKPFVDPVTKEKICFCHGEKGLARIQEDMEGFHHYLEPCAGGNAETPIRAFQSKEYLSLPFDVSFDEK